MENIIRTSRRLIEATDTKFHRYLYHLIRWNEARLIMIKGARGVGKTTLMLQHIKETFGVSEKAIYASCDNIWFTDNKLLDLVEYHYTHGGTHLFLDEIHRYPGNWNIELKNIYDSYPGYNVVFTGSSIIHLDVAIADLSRRCTSYHLFGLSFREYLLFEEIENIYPLTLQEVFDSSHKSEYFIANLLNHNVLSLFNDYLKKGYYPFYKESTGLYYDKIEHILDATLLRDLPAAENIEFETLDKIRRLLYILATDKPFTLNVASLSQKVGLSRNMIIRMFDLLDRGSIIRCIYKSGRSPKSLVKPFKILFDNTDLMAALGAENDIGSIRETYVASMLAQNQKITEPLEGDFLINDKYTIEVGGKGKKYKQIADLPDSYLVVDDEEVGFGNRLPLWILGFLY